MSAHREDDQRLVVEAVDAAGAGDLAPGVEARRAGPVRRAPAIRATSSRRPSAPRNRRAGLAVEGEQPERRTRRPVAPTASAQASSAAAQHRVGVALHGPDQPALGHLAGRRAASLRPSRPRIRRCGPPRRCGGGPRSAGYSANRSNAAGSAYASGGRPSRRRYASSAGLVVQGVDLVAVARRVTIIGSPTLRQPCRRPTPNGPSEAIAAPTTASVEDLVAVELEGPAGRSGPGRTAPPTIGMLAPTTPYAPATISSWPGDQTVGEQHQRLVRSVGEAGDAAAPPRPRRPAGARRRPG